MSVLVLAEHDNAELKRPSLNAVTAAQALGGEVHLLVAGSGAGPVAEAAARVPGVAKVLHADDAAYEHGIAENLAPLVVGLAESYSHLIASATTFGKERHAARRRSARRGPGLRDHRNRFRERLRAPDLCRQRARDRGEHRRTQSGDRSHNCVRRCPGRGR